MEGSGSEGQASSVMEVPVPPMLQFAAIQDGDVLIDEQLKALGVQPQPGTKYIAKKYPLFSPPSPEGMEAYLRARPRPFPPVFGLPSEAPIDLHLGDAPEDSVGSAPSFHTKEEIEEFEEFEQVASGDEMAKECRSIFDALRKQGFSDAEALELTKEVVRAWMVRSGRK